MACSAPGPEGLRCDLDPHSHAQHSCMLDGDAFTAWGGAWPACGLIFPVPVREGLAALGAVLRKIGAALGAT